MNLILLILTIFIGFEVKSNEPFVILEYNGADFTNSNQNKINRNNKFLKNKNHTTMPKVKEGESLSGILHKYYGNSGLNMRIIEVSVIEINKHAFVRNNPHFLYAGKNLKIPSINEIMNLVREKPSKGNNINMNQKSHIYFFGN